MEHYAGIDVSLDESSVCIVDATGTIMREVKIASEPEALVRYFDELELSVSRIGLEAGPLRHLGRNSRHFSRDRSSWVKVLEELVWWVDRLKEEEGSRRVWRLPMGFRRCAKVRRSAPSRTSEGGAAMLAPRRQGEERQTSRRYPNPYANLPRIVALPPKRHLAMALAAE